MTKKRTQIQGTYSFFVYPNDLMLININIMGSEYQIMHRWIKKFKIVNSSRFCNIIEDFSNLNKLYNKDDHKGAKGRNLVLWSFWKATWFNSMVKSYNFGTCWNVFFNVMGLKNSLRSISLLKPQSILIKGPLRLYNLKRALVMTFFILQNKIL